MKPITEHNVATTAIDQAKCDEIYLLAIYGQQYY